MFVPQDVHHLLPLMSDIESCVSPLPILLRDLCTQPDLMMALSQFSAVTFAYNQHISSVDCGRDLPLVRCTTCPYFISHTCIEGYSNLLSGLPACQPVSHFVLRNVHFR